MEKYYESGVGYFFYIRIDVQVNNFNLSNLNLSNRDTCQFEQKRISVATAVGSCPLCLDRRCDFNDSHWGVAKSGSHSLFF